ncbi:TPA: ABC transporter substrate-binding protein [Escherichia albertii]|uniref:ABC transporter substrate-binding protein n=3 Tax=Escherichia albertii TaxID=208962 RepID=UPI0011F1041B|nr:ABC transporter substrate-binding protein [Escherichia albertii]HCQ4573744.1 ABC transporter substrate-binding protein [Escherichia albertii]
MSHFFNLRHCPKVISQHGFIIMLIFFIIILCIKIQYSSRPLKKIDSSILFTPVKNVLFSANVLDTFITLDHGVSHVNAIQRYNKTGKENALLQKIYPQLADLPVASTGLLLDPEIVMLRKPDAVLTWQGRDEILKDLGLPGIITLQMSRSNQIRQHVSLWLLLGNLTGQKKRATTLLNYYQKQRLSLIEQTRNQPSSRILLLIGGFGKGYWLGPTTHYLNERFTSLGATISNKNMHTGNSDLEYIMQLDPDIIFLSESGTGDQMSPQQLYDLPEWQSLRAIKMRRVYKMPSLPSFTIPVEDPIRLQWIAEILYPNDIKKQTREVIKHTILMAYAYPISDTEIDNLLNLAENEYSANYSRFYCHQGE